MLTLSGMNTLLDKLFSEPIELDVIHKVQTKRCLQLIRMGLFEFDIPELIEVMMGEKHNSSEPKDPTQYQYVYNHYRKVNERKGKWGSRNITYGLRQRKLMAWPPLSFSYLWKVECIKLDELETIPPGLMLRVLETKAAFLFNAYVVLINEKMNKVVLLGAVWELPPTVKNKVSYKRVGRISYFYLGEWSLS